MGDTRYKSLYINGVKISQLVFIPTGGWSNYAALDVDVTFNAGSNTIKIQRDAADNTATDFDYILMSSETATELSDNLPSIENEITGIDIYPNPIHNTLIIKAKDRYNMMLSDVSGRVIVRKELMGTTTDIDMSHYPNGVFLLKATSGNGESFVRKIVKN
jgi:hypothetical protein